MRTEPITRPSRRLGQGVCVAVVDSGVHADHPHVRGVAGGVGLDARGGISGDYVDRVGHGTAVMAAIREKAPAADCYAVRIFDRTLATSASTLIAAIDWAVDARVHVINLSLGTTSFVHEAAFASAVARARDAGVLLVAARDDEGVKWLPGCLPGVIGVQVDWGCPRDQCVVVERERELIVRTSGFARPIPGVDPWRNLHGISFAVANASGLIASVLSRAEGRSAEGLPALLRRYAAGRRVAPTTGPRDEAVVSVTAGPSGEPLTPASR